MTIKTVSTLTSDSLVDKSHITEEHFDSFEIFLHDFFLFLPVSSCFFLFLPVSSCFFSFNKTFENFTNFYKQNSSIYIIFSELKKATSVGSLLTNRL